MFLRPNTAGRLKIAAANKAFRDIVEALEGNKTASR